MFVPWSQWLGYVGLALHDTITTVDLKSAKVSCMVAVVVIETVLILCKNAKGNAVVRYE
jgi:hypothetical protein